MYSTDEDVPSDLLGEDVFKLFEYYCRFISEKTIDLTTAFETYSKEAMGDMMRSGDLITLFITESFKDGPGAMEPDHANFWLDPTVKRKAVITVKYLGVLDQGIQQLRHSSITRIRYDKDAEGKVTKRDELAVPNTDFMMKLETSKVTTAKDLQEIGILAGFDNCMTAATNFRQYKANIALQNIFDSKEDEKIYSAILGAVEDDTIK